jgi:hypothetical protein
MSQIVRITPRVHAVTTFGPPSLPGVPAAVAQGAAGVRAPGAQTGPGI